MGSLRRALRRADNGLAARVAIGDVLATSIPRTEAAVVRISRSGCPMGCSCRMYPRCAQSLLSLSLLSSGTILERSVLQGGARRFL
jgi:hypothetical protein